MRKFESKLAIKPPPPTSPEVRKLLEWKSRTATLNTFLLREHGANPSYEVSAYQSTFDYYSHKIPNIFILLPARTNN